jgi:hypothetical protein
MQSIPPPTSPSQAQGLRNHCANNPLMLWDSGPVPLAIGHLALQTSGMGGRAAEEGTEKQTCVVVVLVP